MHTIEKAAFDFLKRLKENNNRDWMLAHKKEYKANEAQLKAFYNSVTNGLNETDDIEKTKVFRINRDLRFSKDKTPYNVHRSVSFSRAGAHRRGGYHLRLEPGASMLAGGFFNPEPADLLRIRKEFEMDDVEIREILAAPKFKKAFGGFDKGYEVKTAPKGFSKEHPAIDLIKKKSFIVVHKFSDDAIFSDTFREQVLYHFKLMRPFFDYMSEVLTTDLNGVSLLE